MLYSNTNSIPIWQKYTLSIEEASRYFSIGEKKFLKLAEENPNTNWPISADIFLESMGEKFRSYIPNMKYPPKLNDWHHLLILHYIDMADGTPLSDQLMAFGELPGGMVREGGFDLQSERTLSLQFGNCPRI